MNGYPAGFVSAASAGLTVLVALVTGCAKPPDAKPPPPVGLERPAGFDGADDWAVVDSVSLAGTTWGIDAHITQQAAAGPPLRLRAEVEASIGEQGGLTVTNARLEPKALGEPQKSGWPHALLQTLPTASGIAKYLQGTSPIPAGCTLPARKVEARWRVSPGGDKWSLSAKVDGRAVLEGWLHRTGNGTTEGRFKALRWLSFSGEGCVFEQLERYDLKTLGD